MARGKPSSKESKLLILVVDIDNDLYKKAKVSGPLLGRVQNLNGATNLALADPEDPDSNTMFYAVKMYDALKKDNYDVEVATITGSEDEGYYADREIATQLDRVLQEYKSDECILVTDGASDNRVTPIIQSRIKINSLKIVSIKQAEKFESAYFAILEKLREPHYARIIFGLPALLLLLFSVSYLLGYGAAVPLLLIGAYLLIKGFGLEDTMINSFRGFGFSVDRASFVFYLTSILFIFAGIIVALGNYYSKLSITGNVVLSSAFTIEGFLVFLPIALILFLLGRIADSRERRYVFRSIRYGRYIASSMVLWVLLYSFVAWFVGQIYFSQLVDYIVVAVAIGLTISFSTNILKNRIISKMRLKGKTVINDVGSTIGKIEEVDGKRGMIVVSTSFGNPISYNINRIVEFSDNVVIK